MSAETTPTPAELPKQYRPSEHEDRIRARWEATDAFHPDPARVLSGEAEPYCILIPPPNVTAPLHLGHALNNSLQDVLVRVHRMKGFETLWMPGTDHAGIATQTVVEKRVLAEEGKRRTDFERDAFVEKIQAFKDEYEARITEQLKMIGCSCDWARQRFTMDDVCARAVREAFFQLFKDGLIYRGKRLVNWDPVTLTALADDEVEMKEIAGKFYYLRYPLVHAPENKDDPFDTQPVTWSELAARGFPGASDKPDEQPAWIAIATTRPETYLGDTAIAVNPDDPRAKPLRGLMVQLPIVGRVIPIIEDDYVVMPDPDGDDVKAKYATGFLKVTPAHDPNDWLIGLRHDLPVINVMAPDASISDTHGWEDIGDAKLFAGLSREDARARVIKEFDARTVGANSGESLLEEIRDYAHSVGHSYRSHVPIEPYLSDQWYCKVTDNRLRGEAQRALPTDQRSESSLDYDNREDKGPGAPWPPSESNPHDGALRFSPARYAKTYEAWHDNLRDWCISRQLWWGHRIPVWTAVPTTALNYRPGDDVLAMRQQKIDSTFSSLSNLLNGEVHVEQTPPEYGADVYFVVARSERAARALQFLESRISERDGADQDFDARVKHQAEIAGLFDENVASQISGMNFAFVSLTQDTDVLDTWFSSALWPMSTMHWPNSTSTGITWSKYFGTWRDFIGEEHSAQDEFIQRLLTFRDAGDALTYDLVSAADPGIPLTKPDDIQEADDLVCIARVLAPTAEYKGETVELNSWLKEHGFEANGGSNDLLAAFNPTSVLCTGRDIITLWVSRMVMFNRHFNRDGDNNGKIPFHHVYINPIIQDGYGQRMSKSLGNGVDPADIVHSHGADALRYVLCQIATATQDVRMPVDLVDPHTDKTFEPEWITSPQGYKVAAPVQTSPSDPKKKITTSYGVASGQAKPTDEAPLARNSSEKFDIGRNFCNKVWNASRFAIGILTKPTEGGASDDGEPALIDRWMLSRLAAATDRINDAIDEYQFAAYSEALYDVVWRDFCDWYLEAIKPTVVGNPRQRATLRAALDAILRLLHPVTPFLTETIYETLRELDATPIDGLDLAPPRTASLLCTAGWPVCSASLRDTDAEARFDRLRELVAAAREVRAKHSVPPKRAVTLHLPTPLHDQLARGAGELDLLKTLINLAGVTADAPTGSSAPFMFESAECQLSNLADAVDAGAERARLEEEIAQLGKSIGALNGRLSNPGYTEKAPEHLVQQTRDQLEKAKADRDAAQKALERLA